MLSESVEDYLIEILRQEEAGRRATTSRLAEGATEADVATTVSDLAGRQ